MLNNKVKKLCWNYKEEILDDIESGAKPETFKVGTKMKRRKLVEFFYKAVKETAENHQNLIQKSWVNFGVELPMNGSRDGDVATLHQNGVYHSRFEDIEEYAIIEEELKSDK